MPSYFRDFYLIREKHENKTGAKNTRSTVLYLRRYIKSYFQIAI